MILVHTLMTSNWCWWHVTIETWGFASAQSSFVYKEKETHEICSPTIIDTVDFGHLYMDLLLWHWFDFHNCDWLCQNFSKTFYSTLHKIFIIQQLQVTNKIKFYLSLKSQSTFHSFKGFPVSNSLVWKSSLETLHDGSS